MRLKQCPNKHFYDEDIYNECPFCNGEFPKELDLQECVGIIECIFGDNKGKKYILHKGINRIGNSYQMDVRIENDLLVTHDNHCSLIFDDNKKRFSIVPSAGTVTYLNNELLKRKKIIRENDTFRIGRSDYKVVVFTEE